MVTLRWQRRAAVDATVEFSFVVKSGDLVLFISLFCQPSYNTEY